MKLSFFKLLRQARGLSQHELALKTNIPSYKLSLIEKGWVHPKPKEIILLTEILGSNPFEFPTSKEEIREGGKRTSKRRWSEKDENLIPKRGTPKIGM